jgi:hypothetical protein
MSDHESSDRILRLICRRGAYEIIRLLDQCDGMATFGQIIELRVPHPLTLLRALAAEHFVSIPTGGTWDLTPSSTTRFELTTRGNLLVGHLDRIDEWEQQCRRGAGEPRARSWRHLRW